VQDVKQPATAVLLGAILLTSRDGKIYLEYDVPNAHALSPDYVLLLVDVLHRWLKTGKLTLP
jgi:hypothetical protein